MISLILAWFLFYNTQLKTTLNRQINKNTFFIGGTSFSRLQLQNLVIGSKNNLYGMHTALCLYVLRLNPCSGSHTNITNSRLKISYQCLLQSVFSINFFKAICFALIFSEGRAHTQLTSVVSFYHNTLKLFF